MIRSVLRFPALAAGLALAACAPDAWKPASGYEGFLNQVQKACADQRVGMANVGYLLTNPGSRLQDYFVDQTSRLYFGKITPEEWSNGLHAFLGARVDDPGLRCVLDQLQQSNAPAGTPPSAR